MPLADVLRAVNDAMLSAGVRRVRLGTFSQVAGWPGHKKACKAARKAAAAEDDEAGPSGASACGSW